MKNFEDLSDLLFGIEGFDKNTNKPNDKKYWEEKLSIVKGADVSWVTSLEEGFFHKMFTDSNLNLFRIFTIESKGLDMKNRVVYYRDKIHLICSNILNEISENIRTGKLSSTDEIQNKIRWFIYETSKIEDRYKTSLLVCLKKHQKIIETDVLESSNYFISVHIKRCLILIYRQISIIDNYSDVEWQNDVFIKNILTEKFDTENYQALLNYTLKFLKEDSTFINDLYIAVKNIYDNAYKNKENTSFGGLDLKANLMKIENIMFTKMIVPKLITEHRDFPLEDAIVGSERIFEEVYEEIRAEAFSDLPSDSIFIYQEKINILKEYLEIGTNERGESYLESIPRKLLSRLEIDLIVIKANPTINFTDLDRSKFLPIRTKLSVPQLALLFKILDKYELLDVSQKTEMYRTVIKVFETKKGGPISENSFKNNFNVADIKAIDFWEEKFKIFSKEIHSLL